MRKLWCAPRNDDLLRFEFLSSHLAGLRPAGSHCKNNLILTSGSIPHLRLGVSCEERIYHLLTPKGGAKSVRRAKKSGNGRRPAPKTLRGRARARVFDGASFVRSSSRFFAMRRQLCAARNDDYLVASVLSRPAACPIAVFDLLMLLDQAKSTEEKNTRQKKSILREEFRREDRLHRICGSKSAEHVHSGGPPRAEASARAAPHGAVVLQRVDPSSWLRRRYSDSTMFK